MMDMNYFRAIQGAYGYDHEKDVKQAEFQRRFGWDFDSSINIVHDVLRNDSPQDFIIVATKTGCDWWCRPGDTCSIGDILYYNGLHWLVTDVNFHDDLTRSGEMVRCNRQIWWQNQKTGEIINRWCLVTKPYTSNISEGMAIANSNREFKVQLSYDEETLQVDLDRRFLLEVIGGQPKAYKIVSVDAQTNKYQDVDGGFLVWNMEQCEYNPDTDNATLMIADYIAGVDPVPSEEPSVCFIEGRTSIPCGRSRIYTAVFPEASGAILPMWDVVAPGGVSWDTDGMNLILNVEDIPSLEGTMILITVQDELGGYVPYSLNVEVTGLL